MFKVMRSLIVLVLLVSLLPASAVMAQGSGASAPAAAVLSAQGQPVIPPNCELGADKNGSQTLICAPAGVFGYPYSATLVIFAHGYVWSFLPDKVIPWDQMVLPDPTNPLAPPVFVPDMVTNLGYYFATTSYRANGLVVKDALQDLLLVRQMAINKIRADLGNPELPVNVILAGVSEGGLITTLSLERYADKYAGGLAMCGPIGSFRKEIEYWGNFRTLFDVYYSELKDFPPDGSTTIRIPDALVSTWYNNTGGFQTGVLYNALNPYPVPPNPYPNIARTQELLYVAQATYSSATQPPAPIDPSADPFLMYQTILGLLNYNIFATNNGQEVLGGNPYGNDQTVYPPTFFYPNLNELVGRYTASPKALAHLIPYETSGQPLQPLVVLHTTGDPIVPYWHAQMYQDKVAPGALVKLDTVERYGHCAFTGQEVLGAFFDLAALVNAQMPLGAAMRAH